MRKLITLSDKHCTYHTNFAHLMAIIAYIEGQSDLAFRILVLPQYRIPLVILY